MAQQLLDVALDDKYTARSERIFLTGVQALVRLPLVQRRRDLAAGLNTAGYVTGYRGSPLGAYDQQLERARPLLDAAQVIHRPGVNEDLAATACSGTQQAGLDGEGRHDGVFAIWYAKGPGVDRSGDAIRHGNLLGTAEHGGVLLLLGDDHLCESSTTAHQSEHAMVDAMVPVLNPGSVAEILDYGLLGIAMSRYSGAWVALKCVHDTVESTASIPADPDAPRIVLPNDHALPPGGLNVRWPDNGLGQRSALAQEERLHVHKLDAARAFARVNRLDRVVLGGAAGAWLGVATTGKSWLDLIAALDDLGIDGPRARELGLLVYKVGMTWPLEPRGLEEALGGLERVLVVEEKRGLIEGQAKELLYHLPSRPAIEGKRAADGSALFPSHGSLSSNQIAVALARRLLERRDDAGLRERLAALEAAERAAAAYAPAMVRLPYFCPGCPHSGSTRLPEGSKALAGIGCHFMVQWMDRDTRRFTQMGGEGASWVGEAPFSTRQHIFQNVGDGTFYHSGSLAVRAAVASGANVTFKVLYNDAVAMTGGQKMETGNLDVPAITRLLEAEGVRAIAIVADDPGKYPRDARFAPGVRVHHRDELDEVQRRLREVEGVSALVFDQTCAAEKRRRRKRGTYPDPDERVVINERVCEGCGDCGRVSNCVAIQPVETELGRKRRIDQSACNKDFSCLKGFCPSFVTVVGGRLRRAGAEDVPFPVLPKPAPPALDGPFGIVVAGVGGTGVVTVAALLGMAAHLEGKGVAALDMIGLAQKGGAVISHLKIAPAREGIGAPRVAAGAARLVLGCDLIVAAGAQSVPTMRKGVTAVVANRDAATTGDFTRSPDLALPVDRLERAILDAAGPGMVHFVGAGRLAARLVGDAIGANLFLVGYAWQRGLIPLGRAAIERAVEVNGVQVELNLKAFLWGRRAAHDLAAVRRAAGDPADAPSPVALDELVERRAALLAAYQDRAHADRYRALVARVREAEARAAPGRTELAEAAARGLHKLMAVKDEYEVARLWTDGGFVRQLRQEFASWDRLEVHLAPPVLGGRDPRTGVPRKRRFGPWMLRAMRALAAMRRLRGTPFDPFGRTAERRAERRLLARYEALLAEIAERLTPDAHGLAVEAARAPERIRGFGHVKAASVAEAEARWAELLALLRDLPDGGRLRAAE